MGRISFPFKVLGRLFALCFERVEVGVCEILIGMIGSFNGVERLG